MMRLFKTRLFVATTIVAVSVCIGDAAEVYLKSQCSCRGPLVLLGDVADVRADDAEETARLSRIELCPAPAAGGTRVLRLREIQDALALRDVDATQCRFFGASTVTIRRTEKGPVRPAGFSRVTSNTIKQAQSRVQKAIVDHLQQRVDSAADWEVVVELDRPQTQRISELGDLLTVEGGRRPYVGVQQFAISGVTTPEGQPVAVRAHVTAPAMIVVATRSLRRGATIQSGDVELKPTRPVRGMPGAGDLYRKTADVVGLATTRSFATGQPIDRRYVRLPIVVRRNETVMVRVRAPGVMVRTYAKVLEDGSRGDLVTLESLTNRDRYSGRVTGIQEVTVYPQQTTTAADNRRVGSAHRDALDLAGKAHPTVHSDRKKP